MKYNRKRACIFHLILLGIISILMLFVRTGDWGIFRLTEKSTERDESYLSIVPNFGPKKWNWHFKLKFCTYSNLNMQNSIVMLTFFCFLVDILFLVKFGPKKSQIVSLIWNLVPRLIWICRTQQWFSLYLYLTGSNLFLEICFKKLNLLKLKFRTYTNSNMQNSRVIFLFSRLEVPFLG